MGAPKKYRPIKWGGRRELATGLQYEDFIQVIDIREPRAKIEVMEIQENKFGIMRDPGTLREIREFLYNTEEWLDGKMDFLWEFRKEMK